MFNRDTRRALRLFKTLRHKKIAIYGIKQCDNRASIHRDTVSGSCKCTPNYRAKSSADPNNSTNPTKVFSAFTRRRDICKVSKNRRDFPTSQTFYGTTKEENPKCPSKSKNKITTARTEYANK